MGRGEQWVVVGSPRPEWIYLEQVEQSVLALESVQAQRQLQRALGTGAVQLLQKERPRRTSRGPLYIIGAHTS